MFQDGVGQYRIAHAPKAFGADPRARRMTAYIRSQAEAGKYALVGPFLDDDRIRGIAIINAASAEEAGNIASADPMVQSGRMAVEIHPAMLTFPAC